MGQPEKTLQSDQHHQILKILLTDVQSAKRRNDKERSAETRRALLRIKATAIETAVSMLCEFVLNAAFQIGLGRRDEALALSEQTFSISENGKVTARPKYDSVLSRFRASIRILDRISDSKNIEIPAKEWECSKKLIDLRNKLTHPKTSSDLDVSVSDINDCSLAFYWIMEIITTGLGTCNSLMSQHIKDMEDVLSDLTAGDSATWEQYNKALLEGDPDRD